MGTTITREMIGTLIDAVYAIAVTILALEFPGDFGEQLTMNDLFEFLMHYVVSFFILFALWMQHRRIAGLADPSKAFVLWTHATVLLLVCLIPRATALVFHDGGNVTLGDLFHGWGFEEVVDVFYILLVGVADVGLIILLFFGGFKHRNTQAWKEIMLSKIVVSCAIGGLFALSFLSREPNRVFLLIMPVALILEGVIVGKWGYRKVESV